MIQNILTHGVRRLPAVETCIMCRNKISREYLNCYPHGVDNNHCLAEGVRYAVHKPYDATG
jgi:hypothetical protein